MPHGHGGRGRSRNTWKRDLEKEMLTAGFGLAGGRWRWQNRTELGGDKWSCGLCSTDLEHVVIE